MSRDALPVPPEAGAVRVQSRGPFAAGSTLWRDVQGRLKINPLADWSSDDIASYFAKHNLPPHPLVAEGYPSIGCSPCTSKVAPGEDPRSGRWRGWDKTECGIHEAVSPIGDDPANDPAF